MLGPIHLNRSDCETMFRIFLRALWVARVPVASLLIAASLFLLVPQVQDQLIELKLQGWHTFLYWSGFFLAGLLFWVLPVHFSARIALQLRYREIGVDTEKRYRIIVIWLPRMLGVLCLASISLGILQAWAHLPNVENSVITDRAHHILFINLLVSLGLIILYLAAFRFWSSSKSLQDTENLSPKLFPVMRKLVHNLRREKIRKSGKPRRLLMARAAFLPKSERLRQRNTLITLSFFLLVLWLISLLVWLIYLAVPHSKDWIESLTKMPYAEDIFFEYVLPRAILLLTIFGQFVPVLTVITILSHKLRHPLLVYGALLLATASVLDKHRFDMRIDNDLQLSARIPIETAVETWMRVNKCEDRVCRPIIVAAEGGASRSAFFTASALALMQDRAKKDNKDFTKNIFAVTGVSGGALGAATFVLADEAGRSSKMKPNKDCTKFCGWFGWHLKADNNERQQLDKAPLTKSVQLFLANDFLTPSIAAYVFYDIFRLGKLTGAPNRVVYLEEGWERHFSRVTGSDNFSKHFSQFAPETTKDTEDWRPLMVFYGSSVETGKRIIVSPLSPRTKDNKAIFRDSDDLYELACKRNNPQCDVRMSTAVTTSARFPIVSAPGNIIGSHGKAISHVVDGGYFDYFAISTAVELAQAFQEAVSKQAASTPDKPAPRVIPRILLISNDPVAFPEKCGLTNQESGDINLVHSRAPLSGKWLRFLRDPLDTALNSRIARARHAAETATTMKNLDLDHIVVCPQKLETESSSWKQKLKKSQMLSLLSPGYGTFETLLPQKNDKADQFKHLSMSWWLSLPVQEYLNKQLSNKHNQKIMAEIIADLPDGVE